MLEGLNEGIIEIGEGIKTFVTEKPIISLGVGAGVVGVSALAGATLVKKVSKKRKKRTTRGRSRDRKFKSKQKHEQKYKRKKKYKVYKRKGYIRPKKGTKKRVGKIYLTKKGQPYKIMASGKARFVKKGGKR